MSGVGQINLLELLCGWEEDSAASASSVTGPGAAGAGVTIRGLPLYDGKVDVPPDFIPADDKDWTWVLERPCPECGFDASGMPLNGAGDLLAAAVSTLRAALERQDARTRPAPTTWSPLEYACHVRDTCDVFRERIALVLSHDDPTFADWDQDVTALERRYADQDSQVVAAELDVALSGLSRQLAAIPSDAWARPALRSNGSRFTLATLIRYLVHDPVHHAHDVCGWPCSGPGEPLPARGTREG